MIMLRKSKPPKLLILKALVRGGGGGGGNCYPQFWTSNMCCLTNCQKPLCTTVS